MEEKPSGKYVLEPKLTNIHLGSHQQGQSIADGEIADKLLFC